MEVRLLGAMEAVGEGGAELPVQGAKLRALLAMLALDAGRVVPTDRLIEGLWQGEPPAGVTNSLQRLVSKLRKAVGSADMVAMRPPGYVLVVDPEDVDAHRLDRLAAEARRLVMAGELDQAMDRFLEAEALWRGPALVDFAYAEFAQPHIGRLGEVRLSLIEDRVEAEQALGRHHGLIGDLEVLVRDHPIRERLRCLLMLALYRDGRQADALRKFQEGRKILAEELGLDPSPALRDLEAAILRHDPALSLATPATARPSQVERSLRRTNAPPSLTRLVGREMELAAVAGLLERHRLVTLAGPGGAGKTRMAIETAQRAVASGEGDVVVVELAAIGDSTAVPAAIAAAFDLREPEVDSMARVRERCEGREVLLVLDNCEQLVDAAAQAAAEILTGGPSTRMLATSREALRVPGEAVWVVPPLQSSEAVELFIDRATAADASFEVSDEDRSIIADICARLDGLPLAIELAAARTRAFTVRQIFERLDDRFRLLSGGARTVMARQQTLRAVVDWSYDLLFEDERQVFELLSVFPGGCSIAAAERVCTDGGLDETEIFECVAALVDKSLLTVDRSAPEARYGMLQTLSQYGRERLVDRGEADTAFRRMAHHMAELCQGSRGAFRGINQREWFRTVDVEQANIRAAFEWAVGADEKDLAVALAADMAFDRWIAGGTVEGHRWFERAFRLPGPVDDPFVEGWARQWHAFLSFVTGHRERFQEQFAAAIDLLRDHADPVFVAYALAFEWQLVDAMGQRQQAIEINQRLISVLATTADPWARGATPWAEAALAVLQRGDFDAFEAGLRHASVMYGDVGDQFMTAVCLDLIGELAENRGDLADATASLTAALDIVIGWRMRSFEAALIARLARAAMHLGAADAEDLVHKALGRADDVVFRPGRAMSLNTLANLRRHQGRLVEAQAAAREALDTYRAAPVLGFSSSFSRAPTTFDVPVGISTSLSVLGFVAEAEGQVATAIEQHRAAYDAVAATAHPRAIPVALEGLAAAVLLSGEPRWSAQLLGRSAATRTEFGTKRTPTEQADVNRVEIAAIAQLGEDVFTAALDEGARAATDRLVAAPATA